MSHLYLRVIESRVLRKLSGSDRVEVTASLRKIQSDSKLLSGFPLPAGMEVKAVMNNPPNTRFWYI
jgi:hypothetical protein